MTRVTFASPTRWLTCATTLSVIASSCIAVESLRPLATVGLFQPSHHHRGSGRYQPRHLGRLRDFLPQPMQIAIRANGLLDLLGAQFIAQRGNTSDPLPGR